MMKNIHYQEYGHRTGDPEDKTASVEQFLS